MENKYTDIDLLIVGAGPMGIATGIEAQKNNLSHVIIEKGALVNSIFHFPKNMTFFSTSEKLEIGDIPFMSIHEKPSRDEALEYYRRVVEKWNLNVKYYEEVLNVEKVENKKFKVTTSKGIYYANYVVIATGFYGNSNKLNIPGEELNKVSHYFDDAHRYIGQKVVVVGAGNSATQVALELYYKGAEVTMIIRDSAIGDNVKYWIKPNIENRIEEGAIKAFFNASLSKIDEDSVTFIQNGKEFSIENDYVLAMIGYQPDYEFLNKIGVLCNNDDMQIPNFQPDSHQTNQSGIYIAGVVCGGLKTNTYFIENSMEHAEKIIQSILRENS
ncbi:MAG: YpdA family putative bacillithiol disulfide reductase [Weeksellaceae bacterium]